MKQKYHIIIELLMIVVISILLYKYNRLYDVTEAKINRVTKKVFSEIAKKEFFGECADDFKKLFSIEDNKNYRLVYDEGNYLLNNGYENDKYVLRTTAKASYKLNKKKYSIELFNRYLKGIVSCEFMRLPDDSLNYHDDAQIHYMLSMIYKETGQEMIANREKNIALALIKIFYEMRNKEYNEAYFTKLAESSLRD